MPPWWQIAFSSSKSNSDDNSPGKVKNTLKSAIFSSRRSNRQPRGKKARQLKDNEDKSWHIQTTSEQHHPSASRTKSINSAAQPSPVPLPLPELQVLLRLDAESLPDHSCKVPKPSPCWDVRERLREKAAQAFIGATDTYAIWSKLASHEVRKTEYSEPRSATRTPQLMNTTEKLPDNIGFNGPTSAPTSPYSSTQRTFGDTFATRTPQLMNATEKLPDNNGFNGPTSAPTSPYSSAHRTFGETFAPQYVTPPACFQVWSAPEALPSVNTINFGYTEKTSYSVDTSPHHSPRASPRPSVKSPRVPPETSLVRRETTSPGHVYRLPRPPIATPSQIGMASHHSSVPEVRPVKTRWQKGKLIGRGTFGSVYAASNRETGALCAMKEVEILPDDPKSAECIKQLEQEIKVLSNLKHPNIVQYYGSEIVGDRFYIYLEYVHPGAITKFIKDHCGAITESVVRNFTRHILSGLAYLHSTKTIHRDIKGANLLVDAFGVVKLADFGMAKHLNGHRENLSLKGSPYWMAPELLQSVMHEDAPSDIRFAVDIWSLGCTIVEMLTGRPPWSEYEGAAAMFKVLKENPPIPDNISEEGRDFLNCCFKRNPAERASASTLLEHRFVKGPLQAEVPSLSGLNLAETTNPQREQPSKKIDRVPLYYDTQSMKGKMADNESGQRWHPEASNLMMLPNLSPRSTLEAIPGLSPPHPSC